MIEVNLTNAITIGIIAVLVVVGAGWIMHMTGVKVPGAQQSAHAG